MENGSSWFFNRHKWSMQKGRNKFNVLFTAGPLTYQVSLESLLIGHEDWVYSVQWQVSSTLETEGVPCYQSEIILSAPMDKTMMIWKPEKTSGIWMNVVTVRELSHCALGFYGGHWSPSLRFNFSTWLRWVFSSLEKCSYHQITRNLKRFP